jgi:uncharacterized protein
LRIVVISDTHMPKRAKKLPDMLTDALKSADLILHAGDWQTVEVYKELSLYGPVEGVYGNVDGEEIKALFDMRRKLEIDGFKIGIVHGHGQKGTTEKRAVSAFNDEKMDIIIFGHSHIPVKKQFGDVLLFNPGSPTDKRKQSQYSFGVITIDKELKTEHVFFDSKE